MEVPQLRRAHFLRIITSTYQAMQAITYFLNQEPFSSLALHQVTPFASILFFYLINNNPQTGLHPVLSDLQVLLSSNTAGLFVDNCSPIIIRSFIAGNDGPGIETTSTVINVDASQNNTITENSGVISG